MNNPPEDMFYNDMVGMAYGRMGMPYSSTVLAGVDDPATDFGYMGMPNKIYQPPASTGGGGTALVSVTWIFT